MADTSSSCSSCPDFFLFFLSRRERLPAPGGDRRDQPADLATIGSGRRHHGRRAAHHRADRVRLEWRVPAPVRHRRHRVRHLLPRRAGLPRQRPAGQPRRSGPARGRTIHLRVQLLRRLARRPARRADHRRPAGAGLSAVHRRAARRPARGLGWPMGVPGTDPAAPGVRGDHTRRGDHRPAARCRRISRPGRRRRGPRGTGRLDAAAGPGAFDRRACNQVLRGLAVGVQTVAEGSRA